MALFKLYKIAVFRSWGCSYMEWYMGDQFSFLFSLHGSPPTMSWGRMKISWALVHSHGLQGSLAPSGQIPKGSFQLMKDAIRIGTYFHILMSFPPFLPFSHVDEITGSGLRLLPCSFVVPAFRLKSGQSEWASFFFISLFILLAFTTVFTKCMLVRAWCTPACGDLTVLILVYSKYSFTSLVLNTLL